jgi:hypothetical protein
MTTTTQSSIGIEIDDHLSKLTTWLASIEMAPGVDRKKYLGASDLLLRGFDQLRAAIAGSATRLEGTPRVPRNGRSESPVPVEYRLRVTRHGAKFEALSLQGLYRWWDGKESGEEWRDIPAFKDVAN